MTIGIHDIKNYEIVLPLVIVFEMCVGAHQGGTERMGYVDTSDAGPRKLLLVCKLMKPFVKSLFQGGGRVNAPDQARIKLGADARGDERTTRSHGNTLVRLRHGRRPCPLRTHHSGDDFDKLHFGGPAENLFRLRRIAGGSANVVWPLERRIIVDMRTPIQPNLGKSGCNELLGAGRNAVCSFAG
jgi:hypothetical protein